jgi:hypothetical protein
MNGKYELGGTRKKQTWSLSKLDRGECLWPWSWPMVVIFIRIIVLEHHTALCN